MAEPSLSIIVATWNAAGTLERCLASISGQSSNAWELLIADGGSSDGTLEIIRRNQQHIHWWRSERDEGIYDAWNKALSQARGDYVCFLGADDAWSDDHAVEALLETARNASPDIISAKGQLVDESGRRLGKTGGPWSYRALRRRMRICHPGALFRRDLFATVGTFDTQYRIVADYEWLLRLPPSTSAVFLDRVVVLVGHGGVSRAQVLRRLSERRVVHARSPRVGKFLAYVFWLDKLWRLPIARLLGLQH